MNGFIKLHRKMIEWGWYSDCVVKDVFLHILMVAAFRPGQYLGHEIKPGQAVIGLRKLSKELGFSIQQVRTALKKLESTGEISLFSTNKFTIATVENWTFYQDDDEDSNKQATNKQQTSNKQATNEQQHLKNVKNVKNVKKVRTTTTDEAVAAVFEQIEKCSMLIDGYTREVVLDWVSEYPTEWIVEAIKEAASHGVRKLAYITSVLNNWKSSGGISRKEERPREEKGRLDWIDDL